MKAKHIWFKNPRAVEIFWLDAVSLTATWIEQAELNRWADNEDSGHCRSVGMLVGHSERYWIMVSQRHPEYQKSGQVQRIPKGCVVWFRWLKPQKWQKAAKLKPLAAVKPKTR